MSVLMHLSDLHFGAHEPVVCRAVQALARQLGVSVVVVSGDVTQRATAPQFAQAASFIRGLDAGATVVLPGNHDLPLFAWWLRWGRAYKRFEHEFGKDLEPVRHLGRFFIVGVNTTRPWRHERGSLSSAQIARVEKQLAEAYEEPWRIVVAHHPLTARNAQDKEHRPARAEEALLRWRDAGAQMLLSGHAHAAGLLQPLPGLWVSQAGTAVSHRLRHGYPNSLVILSHEADAHDSEKVLRWAARWDYDPERAAFHCVQRQWVDDPTGALAV